MSDAIGFQIVCDNCGCLSIVIEEPLTATREAVVRCGDCGTSRGTVGALRDLAVKEHSDIVASPPSNALGQTPDELHPATEISRRYAELRRLRQQVELAEWLVHEARRPNSIGRSRKKYVRSLPFHASRSTERHVYVNGEPEQKRPS